MAANSTVAILSAASGSGPITRLHILQREAPSAEQIQKAHDITARHTCRLADYAPNSTAAFLTTASGRRPITRLHIFQREAPSAEQIKRAHDITASHTYRPAN
ncbi:hypothetical protein AC579_2595 [Pseudocercospora musae]|uniref:Uncharacterized protein n=1 Tax=Pseudocercospora musae TaxID=113226 RepID=A0A139IEX0_9PEZI|nr:hypothetical protein AC579_2595 [Pseudocercospora musae]